MKARNTAIVLGGAVALSSAAYALGSQSGGGDANAGTSANASSGSAATPAPRFRRGGFGRPPGPRPRFMPDGLAPKLGVSTAALRAALRDIRPELGDDHVAKLADALGVSQHKLRTALGSIRPDRGERHDELAAALAKELGVDVTKVRAAFDE